MLAQEMALHVAVPTVTAVGGSWAPFGYKLNLSFRLTRIIYPGSFKANKELIKALIILRKILPRSTEGLSHLGGMKENAVRLLIRSLTSKLMDQTAAWVQGYVLCFTYQALREVKVATLKLRLGKNPPNTLSAASLSRAGFCRVWQSSLRGLSGYLEACDMWLRCLEGVHRSTPGGCCQPLHEKRIELTVNLCSIKSVINKPQEGIMKTSNKATLS